MSSVIGTDGLTYYNTSSPIILTDTTFTNSTNYYGSGTIWGRTDPSVFQVSIGTTINSFSNSGVILGGGGGTNKVSFNGFNGSDGLINLGTITTLNNTGAFLGGGGGGVSDYQGARSGQGGAGGGGGAGSDDSNDGGSIVTQLNGYAKINGYRKILTGGGGGPGGNGGTSNSATGGIGYGPFGGGGSGYSINGNGSNATAFGGGGGGFAGGGGGYGGGYGGTNTVLGPREDGGNSGGGGGGGGAGGTFIQNNVTYSGGNGGYGINNTSGTITTLINGQGGLISNTSTSNYTYGPLFYCGNAPTNYQIYITSKNRYGQLWCNGVNSTIGNINFSITTDSTLTVGTYSCVLTGVIPNSSSGTYQTDSELYYWSLVKNKTNTSYYDLVITNNVPCFKEGSKILTNKGYIPVEQLRKGELVKTLRNGYLPIVLIGKSKIYNSGDEKRIKNRLYILSPEFHPELTEDLILTGCHSLLVDSLLEEQLIEMGGEEKRLYMTDDKLRLFTYLDPLAYPYDEEGSFTIYHLALENENYLGNYGIYANGLLVESCSKRYLSELSGMDFIE
jgi:hypothetical protein